MITGARILAARKLLGWSSERLATKAGVSLTMIKRTEKGEYSPSNNERSALRAALEEGGVELETRRGRPRPNAPGPSPPIETVATAHNKANLAALVGALLELG